MGMTTVLRFTSRAARHWHAVLLRLYDSLTRSDAATAPADLIFVMAGRMERKQYGLELYRAGAAPWLALSVGRFEVNRMRGLDWEGFDDLVALRNRTPTTARHFFILMDSSGVRFETARLRRWSTYGEALALRELLRRKPARSVIVVSTDVHLRRVSVALGDVFRDAPVKFLYVAVPPHLSFPRRDEWWARPEDRSFVVREMLKLAGYRLILSMGPWATRRLMRLKEADFSVRRPGVP